MNLYTQLTYLEVLQTWFAKVLNLFKFQLLKLFLILPRLFKFPQTQRVPALSGFWDFKKTALRQIRISGTVGGPLL